MTTGVLLVTTSAHPAEASQTFGDTPLDDVLSAAQNEAACGLSRDALAAMMLAPTFPETGAPPTAAPSPMTLSRYDNQPGLHAFGNPDPAYSQAFFHPGAGAWQFDSAGGWGLSADAAINTFTSAALAADVMSRRWCTAAENPGLTDVQRRAYVWTPWHGCDSGACDRIFNDVFDGVALRNVVRDASVGRWGGMEVRACRLINEVESFTCWFVDPARAQGHPAFRSPGFGPSPITAPFYVYARNGREYRHWLIVDTGYDLEISASKPLTANARNSLVWSPEPRLCDLETARGTCDLSPPPGKLVHFNQAIGPFRPVVGNFNGDGLTDVLWFSPSSGDVMWWAIGNARFTAAAMNAAGDYTAVVGDFNGDQFDDIVWFSPVYGDALWLGSASGFVGVGVDASGPYAPVVGDFNGDQFDDIVWFSPVYGDALWLGSASGFVGVGVDASGPYAPVVGDFNGDQFDDIVWFSPVYGDALWLGSASGFVGVGVDASGPYAPVVGDFNGDAFDDIVWFSPVFGDSLWFGTPSGFTAVAINAEGAYSPFVLDLDGNGQDDVIWYGPGLSGDAMWRALPHGFVGEGLRIQGFYQPLVGRYDTTGGEDVLWFAPDVTPDGVWYG